MRYAFFHTADLHLGAASEGVMRGAPAAVREAVETSTYRAFENLIGDAERERPAFVLFAGDIYNTADENLRARLRFRDGIRKLDKAGIESFVIHGNHDYHTGRDSLQLPESCHVFEPACKTSMLAHFQGTPVARIFGQSYPTTRVTKNLAAGYPLVSRGEEGLLQVALLHGNLDGERSLGSGESSPRDYAPFTLQDLADRGYDYWALGHVHTHRALVSGPHWAVYTGSLQGISPREQGAKGYVSVEVCDASVERFVFRESDVLRWAEISVDLAGCETLDDLNPRIDRRLRDTLEASSGKPLVARLRLTGQTELNESLRSPDFGEYIDAFKESYAGEQPFIWIDDFSVETTPVIDWVAVRGGHSLPAYLLNLAEGAYPEFSDSILDRLREAKGRNKIDLPSTDEIHAALLRAGERAVSLLDLRGES